MNKEEMNDLLDEKIKNLMDNIRKNYDSSMNGINATELPAKEFERLDLMKFTPNEYSMVDVHFYRANMQNDFGDALSITLRNNQRSDYGRFILFKKDNDQKINFDYSAYYPQKNDNPKLDFKFFVTANASTITEIAKEYDKQLKEKLEKEAREQAEFEERQNEKYSNLVEELLSDKKPVEVTSFIDDKEKMKDFAALSKEEFLKFYSYLSEEEYDKTLETVQKKLEIFFEGKESSFLPSEVGDENVFAKELEWVHNEYGDPDRTEAELLKIASERLVNNNVNFYLLEPENLEKLFNFSNDSGVFLRSDVSTHASQKLISGEISDWIALESFVKDCSQEFFEKEIKAKLKQNIDWSQFTESMYNKVKDDIANGKDGNSYGEIKIGDYEIELIPQYNDELMIDTNVYYPDLNATYGETADGIKYDHFWGLLFDKEKFDLPYEEFKEYFAEIVLPQSIEIKFASEELNRALKPTLSWNEVWENLQLKEMWKRIYAAYDVAKNIRGADCEENKNVAITQLFIEIGEHYDHNEGLMAYGEQNGVYNQEKEISAKELAILIKGMDAIKHGYKANDFIRPDEEALESGIDGGIEFKDLVRGYGEFVSDGIPLHIERWDEMGVFSSDADAAKQWEIDTNGKLLINDSDIIIHDGDLEYYSYPDTPENREALKQFVVKDTSVEKELDRKPEENLAENNETSTPKLFEPCKIDVDGAERTCANGLYEGLENALKLINNLKEINKSLLEENKKLEKQIQQFRNNSVER